MDIISKLHSFDVRRAVVWLLTGPADHALITSRPRNDFF